MVAEGEEGAGKRGAVAGEVEVEEGRAIEAVEEAEVGEDKVEDVGRADVTIDQDDNPTVSNNHNSNNRSNKHINPLRSLRHYHSHLVLSLCSIGSLSLSLNISLLVRRVSTRTNQCSVHSRSRLSTRNNPTTHINPSSQTSSSSQADNNHSSRRNKGTDSRCFNSLNSSNLAHHQQWSRRTHTTLLSLRIRLPNRLDRTPMVQR